MPQTLAFDCNTPITRDGARPAGKAGASLLHRLSEFLWRSGERLQTVRELNSLSDRMLQDIGIQRPNIERAVDELLTRSRVSAGRLPS
jgi:uncharacterized protein YjiS (DUF1127 family)